MKPTAAPITHRCRRGRTSPSRSSKPGKSLCPPSPHRPGRTLVEAAPARPLVIQVGDERHSFNAAFTAGRQGNLAISDEFASSHHARFQVAHGLWFIEDLGSTNGTALNGRRFRAPQHLKKGDKIKIGRTVMTVVSA